MGISTSTISSQFQVTIPAWVRKKLHLNAKSELVWIEYRPGEISVLPKAKVDEKNPLLKLCGILKDQGADDRQIVDEFLKEKKHEIESENKL